MNNDEKFQALVSGIKDLKPYWLMIEGGIHLNLSHATSITFKTAGNLKTCTINFYEIEHQVISKLPGDVAEATIDAVRGYLDNFQII